MLEDAIPGYPKSEWTDCWRKGISSINLLRPVYPVTPQSRRSRNVMSPPTSSVLLHFWSQGEKGNGRNKGEGKRERCGLSWKSLWTQPVIAPGLNFSTSKNSGLQVFLAGKIWGASWWRDSGCRPRKKTPLRKGYFHWTFYNKKRSGDLSSSWKMVERHPS